MYSAWWMYIAVESMYTLLEGYESMILERELSNYNNRPI